MLYGHAKRSAERLEYRLGDMVGVRAFEAVQVERGISVINKPLEKFENKINIKLADSRPRVIDVVEQTRATGEIDDGATERFVQRHVRVAVTANTLLVANRFSNRLAKRNANVFYGVMIVDMKITLGVYTNIDQTMTGNLIKHVIKETDSGLEVSLTRAIEIDGNRDPGFLGVAGYFTFSRSGHVGFVRGGLWIRLRTSLCR